MANKKEATPKDYDRWGKTCVTFTDNPKTESKNKLGEYAETEMVENCGGIRPIENGEHIKVVREAHKLSRKQFSELLGIPYRTVQAWELGERKCPDYLVQLIAFRLEHGDK